MFIRDSLTTVQRFLWVALVFFIIILVFSLALYFWLILFYSKKTTNDFNFKGESNTVVTSSYQVGVNESSKGVNFELTETIVVDISGAVISPGVYTLEKGSRLYHLLQRAGGYSSFADLVWLNQQANLSVKLADSSKIYIPFFWEVASYKCSDTLNLPVTSFIASSSLTSNSLPLGISTPTSGTSSGIAESSNSTASSGNNPSTSSETGSTVTSLVSINTATEDELNDLPGIGPVYASRIIENRPYTDLTSLKSKASLSDSVVGKIKDLISFN